MHVERNADGQAVKITITKPADMHQHLRQDDMLGLVAPMVSKRFSKAIIMPNTIPPITSGDMATRYAAKIGQAVGPEKFYPLMTLYLTDTLEPLEVENAANIVGVKYYPRGLTTNSESGVEDPASLWTRGSNAYNVLYSLAQCDLVLLLHAADGFDKNGRELDPYEQEPHFIRESLLRIIDAHPNLKISVEHLSTKWGVGFMFKNGGNNLGCSLTQHHLTKDRRDVFRKGFRPHLMWWPIVQSSEHKEALQALAVADKPFVWLGSDSAPHVLGNKMGQATQECCIGGVLTAHLGIEGYVEAFEDMGALDDRFERFASINGPRFYGLPPSEETLTLVREDWVAGNLFATRAGVGGDNVTVVPFRLGETIRWKIVD